MSFNEQCEVQANFQILNRTVDLKFLESESIDYLQ